MATVEQYGYPAPAKLRRQALRLAETSLPSERATRRPFDQSIGDVQGFTSALIGLLRGQSGAAAQAYDDPLAAQGRVNQAATDRLAALGPEYAVAPDATGGSAISKLLAGKAAAGEYGAKQPGIAASRGALAQTGLVNARGEALSQRREALRGAFSQAYERVQAQALALASANADLDYREHQKAVDWFSAQSGRMSAEASMMNAAGDGGGGVNFDDYQSVRGDMQDLAEKMAGRTKRVQNPRYQPGVDDREFFERPDRPTWSQAYKRVKNQGSQSLRALGFSQTQINKMIRQLLIAAGFPAPAKKGTKNAGQPYDWQ